MCRFSERCRFDNRDSCERIRRIARINKLLEWVIASRCDHGVHCSGFQSRKDLIKSTLTETVWISWFFEGRREMGGDRITTNRKTCEPDDYLRAVITRRLRLRENFL